MMIDISIKLPEKRRFTAVDYLAGIGFKYGIEAMRAEYEILKDNESVKNNARFWSEVWHEISVLEWEKYKAKIACDK